MRAALALCMGSALACGGKTPPRGVEPGEVVAPSPRVLDDFESLAPWTASGSDGVVATVGPGGGPTGRALRLAFDLAGTSGYAVVRRELALDLSGDFELTLSLRGELPRNNLELKFVDRSGENVWWFFRRDFDFAPSWRTLRIRKSQIAFAWGPTADRTLRDIAAVELVVSAGRGGGAGWIEIDDLTLRPRPAPPHPPPGATAIARQGGRVVGEAAALSAVLDGDAATSWPLPAPRAALVGREPLELTVDLGRQRDLCGVLVQWAAPGPAAYEVERSEDGVHFSPLATVRGGGHPVDVVATGEVTARALRVRIPDSGRGSGALAELAVVDAPADGRREPVLFAAAARAPRGTWPRAYHGEQPYWTVVGVDGGARSALLSEDGAVELWPGGPSLEPAVAAAPEAAAAAAAPAVPWAGVETRHTLADGYLPIPSALWRHAGWELEVTALAAGDARRAELGVRYTLRNRGAARRAFELRLALRPLQVNPPTQFLNITGGESPLAALAWSPADGLVLVDGRPALRPLTTPTRVALRGSAAAAHGAVAPVVGAAGAPSAVRDAAGWASAALAFAVELDAGEAYELVVAAPLIDGPLLPDDEVPPAPPLADAPGTDAWFPAALAAMRKRWHDKLDRVGLSAPGAEELVATLRASLAYLLVSRDGPILRPGTRSYARAWIRDGAMIGEALLRLGHPTVAADFLRWFAPHQLPGGKVPCCVDAHGAVAVPEHDSHGQLAYLTAQVYRYGKDAGLARELWPAVLAAMRYQGLLRASERTARNRAPERAARWGLLPPSISHEGYSARPAYSYWDNFWGLRGLDDAVFLARELGEAAAAPLAAERDQVAAELAASLVASAARYGQGVIHGAADLGDFDPTSTTIALAPGVPAAALPAELVAATFERAYRELSARTRGERPWQEYTPYELRLPGAFLRLGWRARAHEALAFYLDGRRPAGWLQWPEVLGRQPRAPRFLGDLPHAWVHSDFARTALDLFAYEHAGAVILAAGVLPAWLAGPGVEVRDLPTPWGPLSYTLRRRGARVELSWQLPAAPPGGLFVAVPGGGRVALAGRAGRRALAWPSSRASEETR